jgi:hypothetical protein
MRKATKGHSEREQKRVPKLSNTDLLEEMLEIAQGDDYDGCFTANGVITYGVINEELRKRLRVWLNVKKPSCAVNKSKRHKFIATIDTIEK